MQLTYLVGVPGAGKSTLVRDVTRNAIASPSRVDAVPVVVYTDPAGRLLAVELGRRRDTFSGTDALSMGILPQAVAALDVMAEMGWHAVFGEGDRLATVKFFDAARTRGWDVTVVHLDTPADVAAERRAARGSAQSEAWLRGRATKVARLIERCRADGYPVVTCAGPGAAVDGAPVLGRFAGLDPVKEISPNI